MQLYVRLQSDLGNYGSDSDQEIARSVLSDCRTKVGINDQRVLDVVACALCNLTEVKVDFAFYLLLTLHVVFLLRSHAVDSNG